MAREITIVDNLVYFQGYVVAELKENKVPHKIMDKFKYRLGYTGEVPDRG